MGEVKKIKIKSAYHYFEDMVNIKDFNSNLLKIDKKSHEDVNIYYIDYITIKKFSDYENIHSVNPLYLIINSATDILKKRMAKKYSTLDSTEKYEEVFSGIISEIKTLNGPKELFYEKKLCKNQNQYRC